MRCHIAPTDGTPARLVATVMATLGNQLVFSPDLTHAAYLEQPEGALPGSSQGSLLITDLDSSETITYYPQAHNIYGWTPNSEYFAFLTNPQLPQAQIGQLGSDAVPAYADADADAAVIDVRWVDANRYLFLAQSARGWDIVLGQIGGISTFLAAVVGRPPSYDFAP